MTVPRSGRVAVWCLLGATGLSVMGNAIVGMALPWLILQRTGSATAAGLVGSAAVLPAMLSAMFGSALIDRIGRRLASNAADVLSALAVAAVPIVDAIYGIDVALMALLVAIGATFDGPGMAARESLRPDVAERSGVPLVKLNSWGETVDNIGAFGGPVVAGLLIGFAGPANTLWVTVAMFLAAVVLVQFGVPKVPPAPQAAEESYLRSVRTGLMYVVRDPVLRAVTLMSLIDVVFLAPLEPVLFPAYLQGEGVAPAMAGLVLASFPVGTIIGSLGYSFVADRFRRLTVLVASLAMAGTGLMLFVFTPPPLGMIALAVGIGIAAGPINPIVATSYQERSPAHLRGRVIGTLVALSSALAPVGLLGMGPVIDGLGAPWGFVIVGAGSLVTAAFCLASKGIRRVDEPADAPAGLTR
ncbi:MFS transporter [Allokutzneria oryzae]|uniref:Multidrug efflux pump Tap n=1 Tax=Allokutzneria oryzae TaxID=1378989 RepID=A0ABV5ZP36_9PSEU